MKTLLILLCLCLPTAALAQGSCPGTCYLGGGVGQAGLYPNPPNPTTFSVTFPNGAGSATCTNGFNLDSDHMFQTCSPDTWNGSYAFGTVTYNDGTLAYTGAAKFWFDLAPADTPYCVYNGITRVYMVRRLKVQSCTAGHTLTNRFIAVSCDGSYCVQWIGPGCDAGYFSENWINLNVSGF